MIKLCPLLSISFLTFAISLRAQPSRPDTAFVADGRQQMVANYTQAIQGSSHLYNGSQYVEYYLKDGEHPYFISDWTDGRIDYDGELYENVPMLYDLTTDNVATEYYYSGEKIQLINTKIHFFELGKRKFVRLPQNEMIKEGFYCLAYDGGVKFYVRWQKSLQQDIKATEVHREFEEKVRYYLVKDGKFSLVKSKKSVLAVLNENGDEVKQFIRKNRLRFKKEREHDIYTVTEFYDHLKKSEVK